MGVLGQEEQNPAGLAASGSRAGSQRQAGATEGCRQHDDVVKPSLEKGDSWGGAQRARTGQAQCRPRQRSWRLNACADGETLTGGEAVTEAI